MIEAHNCSKWPAMPVADIYGVLYSLQRDYHPLKEEEFRRFTGSVTMDDRCSKKERLGRSWKINNGFKKKKKLKLLLLFSKFWSKLSQMCHSVSKIWIMEILLLKGRNFLCMYSQMPGVHRPTFKTRSHETSHIRGRYLSIKNYCYKRKPL